MTRPRDLPPTTPGRFSVHRYCNVITDFATGLQTLSDWAPYPYEERSDTRLYTVQDGDSLYTIAARAYAVLGSDVAPRLAKVIAVFQPDPIDDITIGLERGRLLHIPSLDMVETEIFSAARRADYEG
jgi:hypothetical protein